MSREIRPYFLGAIAWLLLTFAVLSPIRSVSAPKASPSGDWPRTARIATPYDYPSGTFETWEEAVDQAVADGANVILDWACVSGDWRCLYDPKLTQDIQQIHARADYVHTHHPGVHYVLYVAPLEYVTPDVDEDGDREVDPGKEKDSLAIQHPEWAQMGVSGERAIFYGVDPGMPFWVCLTCEDVWVTPAHPEYRRLVLQQATRLATSGVDGIWFDVPFLCHTFGEAWADQWPDVSPEARVLFHQQTGHTLPEPPLTPDWNDPLWRAFVAWRYRLIREFVGEYLATLRSANPDVRLIMESSVGFNVHATQTGASPLDLPAVSDLTAHERGGTERSVQYYSWLAFLAELLAWRHVDISYGQPSWLLSYVEAGHPDTLDVARLHGAAVLAAGMNYYTSGNETMSGVPDAGFRRQLFAWVRAHEDAYYDSSLRPYANVALIYSQQTLDYLDRGSWESEAAYHDAFAGMAMMLLESRIPFNVITERELERLPDFQVAVLPFWGAMSEAQAQAIRDYVASGGVIIATGPTSLYDEQGVKRPDFGLADVFGVHYEEVEEGQVYVNDYGAGRAVYALDSHEREYFWAAQPWPGGTPHPSKAEAQRQAFLNDLWAAVLVEPLVEADAPRGVLALPWLGDGRMDVRLVNLHGVDHGDAIPEPMPSLALTVTLPSSMSVAEVTWLDYLGSRSTCPYEVLAPARLLVTVALSVGGTLQVQAGPRLYLPLVMHGA